jgi:hypothetical protein
VIHNDELSMLKESLPEYLRLARLGIEVKKDNGAVLGYPSATLLLAVVDIIGSHLRKRSGVAPYTVRVNGVPEPQPIEKPSHHFRALNSPYFAYAFSAAQIKALYELSRCALTHSALLGLGIQLSVSESIPEGIAFRADGAHISLPDFLERCERAVAQFLEDAPKLLPDSAGVEKVQGESNAHANAGLIKKLKEAGAFGESTQSASASGVGSSRGRIL